MLMMDNAKADIYENYNMHMTDYIHMKSYHHAFTLNGTGDQPRRQRITPYLS